MVYGETAMMIARPWWRVLVVASLVEHYGVSRSVVSWGSREILAGLNTDAVTPTGIAVLPEGCRVYLLPTPMMYRGKP